MSPYLRSLSPSGRGTGRRNCMGLYFVLAAIFIFTLFVYTPLPSTYDHQRDALVKHVAGATTAITKSAPQYPATLETTKSKYAFATLLASDAQHPDDQDNLHDEYFIATRLLAYQILHAPETRSKDNIPFIVLATRGVSEAKRDRLRRDGAIVLAVETIPKPAWVEAGASNWEEVFDKLRLWELVQFERICFLDGDTVLNRPLDGVFLDPAAATPQETLNLDNPSSDGDDNETPLPATYVFAGQPEMNRAHHYPPSDSTHDYPNIHYLNAGFFVLQPSLPLLHHYLSILSVPNSFVPKFPEQNLLNFAHRSAEEGGRMPWSRLGTEWNLHYPTRADLEGGVASLHEKWWAPSDEEGLGPYLRSWRWRMEGFYEGLDREGLR